MQPCQEDRFRGIAISWQLAEDAMTIPLQTVPMIVFVGMVLCWFLFATGPALVRALDAVIARTKRSSCGRRTSR